MIIKIRKSDLTFILNSILVILILTMAGLPIVHSITVNTTRANFKVELVILNRNPQINVSNATAFSVDPVSGGNVFVFISFNVTDPDGEKNINASTAVVNFTLGSPGGQYYANISAVSTSELGTCYNGTDGSTVVQINCSVGLPYFANQSSNWVVNITVKDLGGGIATNDTLRFTINTLDSVSLPVAAVNFSNVNLSQQNVRAYPHLLINNTGNDDFGEVNMTAAALIGTTDSSQSIGVTNFGVNLTNSTGNLRLSFPASGIVNLQDINGGNASLTHGHTSAFSPNADKGNLSAFLWVNVPSSGLSSQLYNATWNITVVKTP